MIHKKQSPLPGCVQVVFELPACVWADRIFVVGDFNQWMAGTTPMRQDRDGIWRAAVDLPNGCRCDFCYLIDGQWTTDYHADTFAGNGLGNDQSIICAVLPEAGRLAAIHRS